ncbi:MAG: PilN domain-containing protein [Candidatus Omnitrophica bacterium]|nr:PilN domain-containing protein [Candidatus Omnitrophota bacterium]MBU1128968.1 PilN domain-containing protein [Candidatus Omnitrophota bacterium]MBU1657080.1 PilN domain-containing protein [Candidatus Omnitrophota bacterium]MBU1784691.1 PilN domain-containing protein [Candidatus Omnitrophota bacterium]MBU1850941.1 PilN domain-containing protein [Candidatus Omnitrophota bacterium]
MIELNLLPKELRKKKQLAMPDIPVLPIAISVLVLMVVMHAVVLLSVTVKRNSLKQFNKEWKELRPGCRAAEELNSKITGLERRLKVTRDIANPALDWVELLGGLNMATIPNVWLSEFKPVFSQSKGRDKRQTKNTLTGLELSGYALGRGEATSTVGEFIDSLKKNNEFSKYFSEIELQGIHNRKFDNEEVMSFKLVCRFKQPDAIPKKAEETPKKK